MKYKTNNYEVEGTPEEIKMFLKTKAGKKPATVVKESPKPKRNHTKKRVHKEYTIAEKAIMHGFLKNRDNFSRKPNKGLCMKTIKIRALAKQLKRNVHGLRVQLCKMRRAGIGLQRK